jgi:hypothetical protein
MSNQSCSNSEKVEIFKEIQYRMVDLMEEKRLIEFPEFHNIRKCFIYKNKKHIKGNRLLLNPIHSKKLHRPKELQHCQVRKVNNFY